MKHQLLHKSADGLCTYVLIFESGDEIASTLGAFAKSMSLSGASFTAIGALERATVGWFNWQTKKYQSIDISEQVEVLSLIGDVAESDGKPAVHAHLVVGKSDGTAHGGHLQKAIVRPTLEMILTESPVHLRKTMNPQAGIPLIDLTHQSK